MVVVDLSQLEYLGDILGKSSSDAEEILCRLRFLLSEMQDDIELSRYSQSSLLMESVECSINAFNRSNCTLQSLKSAILPVAETYRENEAKNANVLAKLISYFDTASTSISLAVESDVAAGVVQDDAVITHNALEQLVANNNAEMQVTNIAAIAKVVNEEYEVTEIRQLNPNS